MQISKWAESALKITVAGEIIKQVKEFYLGSIISNDARCHREIKRRIAMEKEAFPRRKELQRGGLKRCLKKRMVKKLIWSVTLYCAETWTLREEDVTRLEAFEMWMWRRMNKISWTEHISNEVLKLVEEERSLLTIIRTRQRNWMGHVMTGDSLPREIIEGRMDCKWGRRRPRKKLLDWMMSEEYSKLKEEAQHRETWNHWRSGPARGQRT